MGRRGRRSTQTPASRPSSGQGAAASAPRMPICAGVACRVSAAVRGKASSVTCEPKSEMVWPSQRRRKPVWRHRPGGASAAGATGGAARMGDTPPPRRGARETGREEDAPRVARPARLSGRDGGGPRVERLERVEHLVDDPVGRAGAGGHADGLHAVEPGRVECLRRARCGGWGNTGRPVRPGGACWRSRSRRRRSARPLPGASASAAGWRLAVGRQIVLWTWTSVPNSRKRPITSVHELLEPLDVHRGLRQQGDAVDLGVGRAGAPQRGVNIGHAARADGAARVLGRLALGQAARGSAAPCRRASSWPSPGCPWSRGGRCRRRR